MKINGKGVLQAAIAALLVSVPSHGALSSDASVLMSGEARLPTVLSHAEISLIRNAAHGDLLAIGRVDAVSLDQSELHVLGNIFKVIGTPRAQSTLKTLHVGDTVALFGDFTEHGYFVSAEMSLTNQYIPGASYVYLRGPATGLSLTSDRFLIGSQDVAFGDLASGIEFQRPRDGEIIEIMGTQPSFGGLVLATWQQAGGMHGNVETANASVGTGKTDASVGTGKTDASVGTGKTDASVGTGKTDASVGTGKTDASVGTGKTDASVGTGKTDASVGTGKTDASVGTGKTDGSAGGS